MAVNIKKAQASKDLTAPKSKKTNAKFKVPVEPKPVAVGKNLGSRPLSGSSPT